MTRLMAAFVHTCASQTQNDSSDDLSTSSVHHTIVSVSEPYLSGAAQQTGTGNKGLISDASNQPYKLPWQDAAVWYN